MKTRKMNSVIYHTPKFGVPDGLYTYEQAERAGYITISNKQLRDYYLKSKYRLCIIDNTIITYGDILVNGVKVTHPLSTAVKRGYICKDTTEYDTPIMFISAKDGYILFATTAPSTGGKHSFIENIRVAHYGDFE